MSQALPVWKAEWGLGKGQGLAGWGKGIEEGSLQRG